MMTAIHINFTNFQTAKSWAIEQDAADELGSFRDRFHIPSQKDLKSSTLSQTGEPDTTPPSIYLCGNSLGLQPKSTYNYVQAFLTQWRTKGVLGHFVEHEDSPVAPFLHIDDHGSKLMAPIVGAQEHEVAVMGTLTGNLHLMMASFYRPTKKGEGKYRILLESKAFPSDHYAIESQVIQAGLDPKDAMILLEPQTPTDPVLTTGQVIDTIDRYADELALVLLPGIQFYSGQYFDIQAITSHAHSRGIMIGWDCAHAVGNVDLRLHDWEVDFAVWCTYKYLNSGPGAMGGVFVHDKHGRVEQENGTLKYRPRLSGWWGDDKSTRFQMLNKFVPRPGAAGFQLSNPSAIDLAAVVASLQIFNEATMPRLRQKSIRMTRYLEILLTNEDLVGPHPPYTIITPKQAAERGSQLSVRLAPGLLDKVLHVLESNGVIVDERKPDVIRVAPAPLYNTFQDVYTFCQIFREALRSAQEANSDPSESILVEKTEVMP